MKKLIILLALVGLGALLVSCNKEDDNELVTCNKVTHKERRADNDGKLCSSIEACFDFYINGKEVSRTTYNKLGYGDCI